MDTVTHPDAVCNARVSTVGGAGYLGEVKLLPGDICFLGTDTGVPSDLSLWSEPLFAGLGKKPMPIKDIKRGATCLVLGEEVGVSNNDRCLFVVAEGTYGWIMEGWMSHRRKVRP